MGCSDSKEVPRRQQPAPQQQQQQPSNNTKASAPQQQQQKPAAAGAASSSKKGPTVPTDGTWQERLAKYIARECPAANPPSRDTLIKIISTQLSQPASNDNDLHVIAQELMNLAAYGASDFNEEERIKLYKGIIELGSKNAFITGSEKSAAVHLHQDYIEAHFMMGTALVQTEEFPRAYAVLTKSRQLQREYHPGKSDCFILAFHNFISYSHAETEKRHSGLAVNDEMKPLGFLKANLDYFNAVSSIYLNTNGQGINNESDKDLQVPPVFTTDFSNVTVVANALDSVVFTFQNYLSKVDGDQWTEIASTAVDTMRKIFSVVHKIDIDDSAAVLEFVSKEYEPEGEEAVNPEGEAAALVKSAIFITLLCIDSVMDRKGMYVNVRHHNVEITHKVSEQSNGWTSTDHLASLCSAAYCMLCGGPSSAVHSILDEIQLWLATYFNDIDFCNIENISHANDFEDDKWTLPIVTSINNFLQIKLILWKETNKNAKEEMMHILGFTEVITSLREPYEIVAKRHMRHFFDLANALAKRYLNQDDESVANHLISQCKTGIAYCRALADPNHVKNAKGNDVTSAVERAAACMFLARTWSHKTHWDAIPMDRDVKMLGQHRQALEIIDMARAFLADGVATREIRPDNCYFEFVALSLADMWERSQLHTIKDEMYEEYDKAVEFALARSNVFAAATTLRQKALLLRKLDMANEAADEVVARAIKLMVDFVKSPPKNTSSSAKSLPPGYRLVLADDTFEVLKLFDPKWFNAALVAACDAGAEELLSSAADGDDESSKCASVLLVSAGSCLHLVGPSKRPEGWKRIRRALQIAFNAQGDDDPVIADEDARDQFQVDLLSKITAQTGLEEDVDKIIPTMKKWIK